MRRRHLLCCGAAGLFGALLAPRAQALTLDEGLLNPCLPAQPPQLADNPWVQRAFEGLDRSAIVDVHAHLLGTGDDGSGCMVHPDMHSLWSPAEFLRRHAILNASCVDTQAASVDRAYVQRLHAQAQAFPAGARWWLFAFDHACDDHGRERADWSTFHVPDAYAARIAAAYPDRFAWVCSVHPYREDAVERLESARRSGAVACKWLPSAMNIALDDARCSRLYQRLAAWQMPLIVHGGEEHAVPGARRATLGNPLHVRHALRHGVTVVMAHAASLGRAIDLDRRSQPVVPAFDLFARLMDETTTGGRLLGDLSAVFQANRRPEVWKTVLTREDWHARLLHGSDYPLPGVMPLFDLGALVGAGLLDVAAAEPLRQIRRHNVLLFDFVLKRHLRAGAAALHAGIFEARALSTSKTAAPRTGAATVPAARSLQPQRLRTP
jgi:uncharacterized protein